MTATNPSTPARSVDLQMIHLVELHPSKTNPRKVFDQGKMDELRDSIKAKGILIPLVVRKIDKGYEIVAGERRYRAARAAGLTEAPCLVRDLTDEQALETQVIENLQRDDIHPLDEAAGYQNLLKGQKWTVETLAGKIGKSTVYVYQRLALLKLIPKLREAYAKGTIELGHALLVSKLTAEQQDRLREYLFETNYVRTGPDQPNREVKAPRPVAWLKAYIQENILTDLSKAPWALDDATLVPKAGPCTACPKRSKATGGLFDDVGGGRGDCCLAPECWAAKLDAHVDRTIRAAGEKHGKPAVAITSSWSSRTKGILTTDQWKGARGITECPDTVPGVFVDNAAKSFLNVIPICAQKDCKVHWKKDRGSAESGAWKAEQRKRAQEAKLTSKANGLVFKALTESRAVKELTPADLRLIVARQLVASTYHDNLRTLCNGLGLEPKKEMGFHGRDFRGAIEKHLAKLPEAQLPAFVLAMCAAGSLGGFGADASILPAVTTRLKVDRAAIIRKVKAEAAAKAKKKAKPAKGKKGGRGK